MPLLRMYVSLSSAERRWLGFSIALCFTSGFVASSTVAVARLLTPLIALRVLTASLDASRTAFDWLSEAGASNALLPMPILRPAREMASTAASGASTMRGAFLSSVDDTRDLVMTV